MCGSSFNGGIHFDRELMPKCLVSFLVIIDGESELLLGLGVKNVFHYEKRFQIYGPLLLRAFAFAERPRSGTVNRRLERLVGAVFGPNRNRYRDRNRSCHCRSPPDSIELGSPVHPDGAVDRRAVDVRLLVAKGHFFSISISISIWIISTDSSAGAGFLRSAGRKCSVTYSAFKFFKIFLANGSFISACPGTASTAPFFGLIQSEWEAPCRLR